VKKNYNAPHLLIERFRMQGKDKVDKTLGKEEFEIEVHFD